MLNQLAASLHCWVESDPSSGNDNCVESTVCTLSLHGLFHLRNFSTTLG